MYLLLVLEEFCTSQVKKLTSKTCHRPAVTLISLCLSSLLLACLPYFQSVFVMSPSAAFPVSLLVDFILFLLQLTGAHMLRALVVVCNESQINAACCHMRDWSTTSNTEQMDTRVWLLEKYFPLMLQTPLLLSVREKKKNTAGRGTCRNKCKYQNA